MKKIYITILSLFLASVATAQEQDVIQEKQTTPHEFMFNASGGLSTLQYSVSTGSRSSSFGGGFGLGYTYNFTETWGFTTGLDLAFYNSTFKADAVSESYEIPSPPITPTPPPGSDTRFFIHGDYASYEEKQSAMYLNIPLMAQYSLPVAKNQFYAAAGFKFGIPLTSTYKADATSLAVTGESKYTGETYTDESLGFRILANPSYDGDLDLKFTCMLALEAGMKWRLTDRLQLYTGAYFDYGLNNIYTPSGNTMVVYKGATAPYSYNSALQSATNGVGVDKINLMTIGIKARIAFR